MTKVVEWLLVGLFSVFIVALILGAITVINFYVINFILSAFNVAFQLTWMQALAVTFIIGLLKNIFGSSSKSQD
jgi:hypothetical protein